MPGEEFAVDGQLYVGFWYENGNRIVLAEAYQMDGPTVRHEMLHAILQRGDHPSEYFVESCGAILGEDPFKRVL